MTDETNPNIIRADYDSDYFKRFLWLALGCLFFGSWFLYDGLVNYPAELERCHAYWKLDKETDKWVAIENAAWRTIAKQNDWSTAPPKVTPDKQQSKIGTQYFYSILSFLITIPCLLKWYLPRGTWIEGDEDGVKTSWGKNFAYSEITEVNKKKWADRGIAKVRYEREGLAYSFTFDDYKYEREPMGRIMMRMEEGLKDDQIVGDDRESVRVEKLKAAAAARKAAEEAEAQTTEPRASVKTPPAGEDQDP